MSGTFAMFPLLIALLLGGGGGGVSPAMFSLPPLPPDTRLEATAPADCLFYLSWAGAAKPNQGSENRTEQLVSEPQIRELFRQVEQQLTLAFQREVERDREMKVLAKHGRILVKTLLTRPTAFFVGDVNTNEQGLDVQAGLVVNAGEHAPQVQAGLQAIYHQIAGGQQQQLERRFGNVTMHALPLPPPTKLYWGMVGPYVVIAAGDATVTRIVDALSGDGATPRWLTDMQQRLKIDRPVLTSYADIAGGVKLATDLYRASAGGDEANAIGNLVAGLGLDQLGPLESIGGLDDDGYVERTFLPIAGDRGLLSLASGPSLKRDSVRHLPGDSTFAVAMSLDVLNAWHQMLATMKQLNPQGQNELSGGIQAMETQVGIHLVDSLLAQLGSTWTIHNAPSDGGLLFTGTTLVVDVKDAAVLKQTAASIGTWMNTLLGQRQRPRVRFMQTDYQGHTIYFIQGVREELPFSPSWCVTDKTLVIAGFPQMIKSHIDRLAKPDAGGSLTDQHEIADVFERSQSPTSLIYLDEPNLFRMGYPILHPLVSLLCAELQKDDVMLDISMLPSASSILPHLKPSYVTTTRTADGLWLESHSTIPTGFGGSAVASTGIGMAMALPAIAQARNASRNALAMNTLKEAAVAVHLYAVDNGDRLPDDMSKLTNYVNSNVLRDPWGHELLYFGKGMKLADVKNPTVTPIFATSHVVRHARFVAFADGHVERVPERRFQRLLSAAELTLP